MESTIDPAVQVGHIHLKVSDVERSERWYRDVLGFETTARYGSDAVFMSAGGYHHHLGLNQWHSKGTAPAPVRAPGLYHFALLYPSRVALAKALQRLLEKGVPLDGAADHGVSEALYLHDPDGNGIELYRDRPRAEWPRERDGSIVMFTQALDLQALLNEARANV